MQRAHKIVGKPIISAGTGEKVGEVADLLVSQDGDRVIGIVVRRGLFQSEQVLPFGHVQTLGRDALVAKTGDGVIDAQEWRRRGIQASRSSKLEGRPVVTGTGRRVGALKDMYLDEETGAVQGYEVGGGAFAGLIERRGVLPQTGGVTLGPDVIIVSDDAARALERDRQPRRGPENTE